MSPWHSIPGHPAYEVSEAGEVRRVKRGRGVRGPVPSTLRPRCHRKGYLCVQLAGRELFIHRLVLLAFVGAPPTPTSQANHIDGDKTNNHLSNLEWVTPAENARHATAAGLRSPRAGESNPRAKITAAQVAEIRAAAGTHAAVARQFGLTPSHVSAIRRGLAWQGEAAV